MARTYLDHNATTPLLPAARHAMAAAFDTFGNPSSIHAEGRHALTLLDEARQSVASLVGTDADGVVFTSGATEALNLALTPELRVGGIGCDRLLFAAAEHAAVLRGHRFGAAAEPLRLRPDGVLDLAALEAALDRLAGVQVMVAVQAANNETGVMQPLPEIAERVRAHGGVLVCDVSQAVGKIDRRHWDGAHVLAVSAHKFGGPKGVGALCFGRSDAYLTDVVIRGGGQERGLRAGTQNVIGIAGLGAACDAVKILPDLAPQRMAALRDAWERRLMAAAPGATIFGGDAARLPNTSCFAVPGYDAQVLLMNLDLAGVAVSAGSACASGKVEPSHVLAAMGVSPELSASALRVSLGWTSGEGDVEALADAFAGALKIMAPRIAA